MPNQRLDSGDTTTHIYELGRVREEMYPSDIQSQIDAFYDDIEADEEEMDRPLWYLWYGFCALGCVWIFGGGCCLILLHLGYLQTKWVATDKYPLMGWDVVYACVSSAFVSPIPLVLCLNPPSCNLIRSLCSKYYPTKKWPSLLIDDPN